MPRSCMIVCVRDQTGASVVFLFTVKLCGRLEAVGNTIWICEWSRNGWEIHQPYAHIQTAFVLLILRDVTTTPGWSLTSCPIGIRHLKTTNHFQDIIIAPKVAPKVALCLPFHNGKTLIINNTSSEFCICFVSFLPVYVPHARGYVTSTASSVKTHLSRKDDLTDKCSQSAKLVISCCSHQYSVIISVTH